MSVQRKLSDREIDKKLLQLPDEIEKLLDINNTEANLYGNDFGKTKNKNKTKNPKKKNTALKVPIYQCCLYKTVFVNKHALNFQCPKFSINSH